MPTILILLALLFAPWTLAPQDKPIDLPVYFDWIWAYAVPGEGGGMNHTDPPKPDPFAGIDEHELGIGVDLRLTSPPVVPGS